MCYLSYSKIKFPQLKVQTARLMPNTLPIPFLLHDTVVFHDSHTHKPVAIFTHTLETHIVSRCNIDILLSGLSQIRLFWYRTYNHPNSQLLFKTNSPFWVKPTNKGNPTTLLYTLNTRYYKRNSSVALLRVRTAPTRD